MRDALRRIDRGFMPDIADIETAGTLRKQWLIGALPEESFRQSLKRLAELPFVRYPSIPLLPRVFALRHNVTPYDAVYVALAEALNCPLVTADAQLANAPGIHCDVQLVG